MWKTNWTTRATAAMIMAACGASLAIAASTAPADVIKQRQQSLKDYERGDFRSAALTVDPKLLPPILVTIWA